MNLVFFADGGSRQNPGPAASAFVLYETKKAPHVVKSELINTAELELVFLIREGVFLGTATNNEAEWQGVVLGLKAVVERYPEVEMLTVLLDSELVVKQILGQYKVKQPHLKPYYEQVHQLLKKLPHVEIKHIFRTYNKEADKLVNEILDAQK